MDNSSCILPTCCVLPIGDYIGASNHGSCTASHSILSKYMLAYKLVNINFYYSIKLVVLQSPYEDQHLKFAILGNCLVKYFYHVIMFCN